MKLLIISFILKSILCLLKDLSTDIVPSIRDSNKSKGLSILN